MENQKEPDSTLARDVRPTLVQRLMGVMADVTELEKSGWNDHHKYAFVPHSEVKDMMRRLFVKHGVFMLVSTEGDPILTSSHLRLVHYVFTLINVDDAQDRLTVRWLSESTDQQDKGMNKAAVAAVKYWSIETFKIPSDVPDPDADQGKAKPKENKPPEEYVAQLRKVLKDKGTSLEAFPAIKTQWTAICKGDKLPRSVWEAGIKEIEDANRAFIDAHADKVKNGTPPATGGGYEG